MGKTKKTRSVGERLGCELELPLLVTTGVAHIELSGNREAVVDGCKGVLEYTEDEVCLNLGDVGVRFCGADICIRSMSFGQTVVSGRFAKIEFT